jgi:hypothetical protein
LIFGEPPFDVECFSPVSAAFLAVSDDWNHSPLTAFH